MQIVAQNLQKKLGQKLAVENISLKILPGQILGLLGPNGAGKSTTIKMLSGQISPSFGNIIIDGKSFSKVPESYRSKIGVMPQEVIIWEMLTLKENLEFTGKLELMTKN